MSIFDGSGVPHDWTTPPVPPWRVFNGGPLVDDPRDTEWTDHPNDLQRARSYQSDPHEVELVNVAIMLRRPLLLTGRPGTGKSTLAYAIAYELRLGPVLRWPISSRTTIQDGLYRYDAIGRLHEAKIAEQERRKADSIGRFLQLGPLGTAFLPTAAPRMLLIDEIDKSGVDLPNDLLNMFEEGEFRIPELGRLADEDSEVDVGTEHGSTARIRRGTVRCNAFPIVVMTSNGERDFPAAFLRRCVRLDIANPGPSRLAGIVAAHLGPDAVGDYEGLIHDFVNRRESGELATDQLLNAIFVTMHADTIESRDRRELAELLIRPLGLPD